MAAWRQKSVQWLAAGLAAVGIGCVGPTIDGLNTNNNPTSIAANDSVEPNTATTGADPNGSSTPPGGASMGAPYVTIVGRYIKPGDGSALARFSWPGVALGFTFTGTGLSVRLAELPQIFAGNSGHAWFDVEVDGKLSGTIQTVGKAATDVPVVDHLSDAEHTVWLRKRTEAQTGSTILVAAEVATGGKWLSPPAPATRRLTTMGSSADTGFGVEGRHCEGYVDAQQNQSKAWPQLTATSLGAQLHNLSASAKGIVTNYDPTKNPALPMPKCYPLADINEGQTAWEAAQYVPDAVVINMGRNDLYGLAASPPQPPPPQEAFVAAFVGMLAAIHKDAPSARMYLVMNPMTEGVIRPTLKAWLQQVIKGAADAGLGSVGLIEMDPYTGSSDDLGCSFHPNAAIHQSMADQVIAVLRRDLGW